MLEGFHLVNNVIQSDLIIRYAETVLDRPLLKYQKKMLEAYAKMPPNTKIIMGMDGKIHFESRTEKKVEE